MVGAFEFSHKSGQKKQTSYVLSSVRNVPTEETLKAVFSLHNIKVLSSVAVPVITLLSCSRVSRWNRRVTLTSPTILLSTPAAKIAVYLSTFFQSSYLFYSELSWSRSLANYLRFSKAIGLSYNKHTESRLW